MNLNVLMVAILTASIAGLMVTAASAVSAQANVCEANSSPVDASDPDITVGSPTAGSTVTSPLTVTGEARTFESTVQVGLFGPDGVEIAATFGTAAAPDVGQHGPFSISLDFPVSAATDACLWVFEDSAKTGEPINVVQVPLSLEPVGPPTTGRGALSAGNQSFVLYAVALGAVGVTVAGTAILFRRRIA